MPETKRKCFYVHIDHPDQGEQTEGRDDLLEFFSEETRGEWLASDAAEDEMNDAGCDLNNPNCWPRMYLIYDPDKTYIGCFSVEMEYSPIFYASEVLS